MCSCLSCDRIKFCIAEYFTASWKPHAGLLTHASKNVAESIVSEYYWNSKEVTEMILMSMNVFLSQLFLLSSCFWILNRQIWHTACDWWSAWHIPGRQQGTLVLYKMYFTLEVLIHVYIWMCLCTIILLLFVCLVYIDSMSCMYVCIMYMYVCVCACVSYTGSLSI